MEELRQALKIGIVQDISLIYSILFYSILFYSILLPSLLFFVVIIGLIPNIKSYVMLCCSGLKFLNWITYGHRHGASWNQKQSFRFETTDMKEDGSQDIR